MTTRDALLGICLVFGACGDDGSASEVSSGESGELEDIMCEDSACLRSCVRRFVPEGSPEYCYEPAAEHVAWSCDAPSICPEVELGAGEAFSPDAAHCALRALRDRTPGALAIRRGDAVTVSITILADGTALFDATFMVAASCVSEAPLSSRAGLELLDPADPLWAACLAEDTADGQADCLLGAVDPGEWTVDIQFPWQSGFCSASATTCPG